MSGQLRDFTDEELLIKCRSASPEKAREIIGIIAERYDGKLFAYLYRMLGKRSLAEDVMQEAFLRLFKHRRRYREVARCSTWLYRIATNLALNAIRDNRKRTHLSLSAPRDESGKEFSSLIAADTLKPEEAFQRKELQEIVQKVLLEVPDKYRAVLVLCDIEGLSYKAASESLGVELGTIRSRLARARAHFLNRFAPYMKELETR